LGKRGTGWERALRGAANKVVFTRALGQQCHPEKKGAQRSSIRRKRRKYSLNANNLSEGGRSPPTPKTHVPAIRKAEPRCLSHLPGGEKKRVNEGTAKHVSINRARKGGGGNRGGGNNRRTHEWIPPEKQVRRVTCQTPRIREGEGTKKDCLLRGVWRAGWGKGGT